MAINYPTSLDSFTNPIAANPLTAPSHAQQHADINDAVEALELKLSIGNTQIGTYVSFTPTLGGITIGNGTIVTKYCTVNELVHYYGKITFGSTTTFTSGNANFTLPFAVDTATAAATTIGTAYFYDVSTGAFYAGQPALATTSIAYGGVNTANGQYVQWGGWSSTAPFTWATGDYYSFNMTYKKA
jgi:hypothetical protein